MGSNKIIFGGLALVAGLACGVDGEDAGLGEPFDRSACLARSPGAGAIVVHYGALHETDPAPAFFDALAGDAETVIVTRALTPNCEAGPFASWRNRGARFRWAYKFTDEDVAALLDNGTFVAQVEAKIEAGWDYVAIDEIGANPGAPIDWTNGSPRSNGLVAALDQLSADGYGRRLLPYFASSTASNPDRSLSVRNILQKVPEHTRIGLLELYRTTSDGHTAAQHRAYFHDKAGNFEQAAPGINDHLAVVLGISNRNSAQPYRFLDQPSQDLASITRQFQALHQSDAITRRHPGVGTYSWGATRHWDGQYTVYELAAHVRDLSNWYAATFGVDAGGEATGGEGGGDGGGGGGGPAPGPTCNEPHEALVDGACVPSCGAAGGNTCLGAGNHACDDYGPLPSYDCEVCCARPELLTIYRSYHPQKRSHKYSLSEADAMVGDYQLEGAVFAVALHGGGSRAPLFQCLKSNGKLFYTTSDACEGAGTNHGALGYVGQAPEGGTRELHRLYHSGNGAHFYAANETERQVAIDLGYHDEGIQGYVW